MESIFNFEFHDILASFCIPLIIAILALALPQLIQSVNDIDDRYSSTVIARLFKQSKADRFFYASLIISLVFIFLYAFQLPCPQTDNTIVTFLLKHSARNLLVFFTIMLLVSLFFFFREERMYNDPYKLKDYLIKQHQRTRKMLYFLSISELFYFAIRNSNEDLSFDLLQYITRCFDEELKDKKGQTVEYPQEYYDLIYTANEQISLGTKRPSSVFNGSVMIDLLFDDRVGTRLHKNTYDNLWMFIKQSLFYDNTSAIKSYWSKAHHHFAYHLKSIHPQHHVVSSVLIQEIKEREVDRAKFKEFHYVMGALVLYESQFDLLTKMMSHSNLKAPSPVYYLVPDSFRSLINDYIAFDDHIMDPIYYEQNYSFPDISGIDANHIIFTWIQRYFAILFLRQLGIPKEYHANKYKISLPNPPDTVMELTLWREKMAALEYWVSHYIHKEEETLIALGLNNTYDSEVLQEREQEHPEKVLNDYLVEVDKRLELVKKSQPIGKNRREEFDTHVVEGIQQTLTSILTLTNDKPLANRSIQASSFIGRSRHDLLSKSAFADNNEVTYMHAFDTTVNTVCKEILHHFIASFSAIQSKTRYIVSTEKLFEAIDKLQIDSNYVILSIGVSLSLRMNYNKPEGLEKVGSSYRYQGIEIVEFDFVHYNELNGALYVFHKDDLPYFKTHSLDKSILDEYKYTLLDGEHKIYTSVLDLTEESNSRLRTVIERTYHYKEELSELVLACIGINYELSWPKGARCVQIKEFNSAKHRKANRGLEVIQSFRNIE